MGNLSYMRPCLKNKKGSMYLCLPTSICKGVSERPRIRRAVISYIIVAGLNTKWIIPNCVTNNLLETSLRKPIVELL
uniref:Uncharacterized protein n=1 Tax=Mus spicilegus TaxID=10103 RepID=A0A8C6MQW9_MUSSI